MAKNQTCIEPTAAPRKPTDWATFFGAIGMLIIAVGTWWNGQQAAKATAHIQVVADASARMEKKVEKVERQSDGQFTYYLRQLAVTAEQLYNSSKSPKDKTASEEAWAAYDERVEQMKKEDAQSEKRVP